MSFIPDIILQSAGRFDDADATFYDRKSLIESLIRSPPRVIADVTACV